MDKRVYPVFEFAARRPDVAEVGGHALAWIIEMHPDLACLLDYCVADTRQIAWDIGMLYAGDDDAETDLDDLDLGPEEWFEPVAGLAVVEEALRSLRADPASVSRVIYEPGLHQDAVISDLESVRERLAAAVESETRFHFVIDAGRRS